MVFYRVFNFALSTQAQNMTKQLEHFEKWFLTKLHLLDLDLEYPRVLIWTLLVGILCYVAFYISRKIIDRIVSSIVKRTKSDWDDVLFKHKTFMWIAYVAPILIIRSFTPFILRDIEGMQKHASNIVGALVAIVVIAAINSVLESIREIMRSSKNFKDKPIASYIQLGKIFLYFFGGILVISILLGESPFYFLSAMGALSAVLLLIFKDTILGFVASIHISVNDMVRVGDWVSMEKYGADGDILEINLATVKVKNWDLTITTIPTYAFVSDSFKNWRGMTEGQGRRIKRAVYINKNSIHHLNDEKLKELEKIKLLQDFLNKRKEDIAKYNQEIGADENPANGRRLTNIGIFRYYLEFYLRNNPNINQEMTLMVRQLDPTPNGLPLEVYAFSKDKRWEYYEAIIADIFDHIFAVAPVFELSFFQNPSGADFKSVLAGKESA